MRLLALPCLLACLICSTLGADTYLQALTNSTSVRVVDTAVARDGSVYVLGQFTSPFGPPGTRASSLRLGNTTLDAYWLGDDNAFLAKLGPDGGWRWAMSIYGMSSTASLGQRSPEVQGLFVNQHHVYVVGRTRKTLGLRDATGGFATVTAGGSDLLAAPYAVKLDLNGRFIWGAMTKAASSSGTTTANRDATVNDIVVDSQDNVFVCGAIPNNSWITFPGALSTPDLPTHGGAYLAKLNSSGAWQWVTAYYGDTFPNEFFAVTVDDLDRIFVTGWTDGDQQDVIYRPNGTTYASTFEPLGVRDLTLIRYTRQGDIDSRRYFTTTAGGFSCGRAIAFHDGKIFVSAVSTAALNYHVDPGAAAPPLPAAAGLSDVLLFRLTADLQDVEKVTQIGGEKAEDVGRHLGTDDLGNIYVSGLYTEQANFGNSKFQAVPDGAPVGPDVTSSKTNLFVGKLNRNLEWQWVQRSEGVPPDQWTTPSLAVNRDTSRVYLSGSFAGGTIRLGSAATRSEWGTSAASGVGFIAALETAGSFLQKVELNVISEFGGPDVQPALGQQVYLRGQTISASAPPVLFEDAQGRTIDPGDSGAITARAVTRHTCTGYQVVDTAVAGGSTRYDFVIDSDTTVRFNWKTEHALDVKNNLAGSQGGLTSTAAGNPDPVVQKHWIEEGSIATAFIDGIVLSPNPNEYGTRYRSTGYQASGAVSGFNGALTLTNYAGRNLNAIAENVSLANRSYTVELWARDDLGGYGQYLISYGTPAAPVTHQMSLTTYSTNNLLAAHLGDGDIFVPRPMDRQWHHHAMVYNQAATTASYYIDGQLVGSLNRVSAAPSAGRLAIGNWINPEYYFGFNGGLDEIRLWSTNRSQAEILANMNRALVGNEPGLQDYWKLDDTSGSFLANSVSPARNATLSGADASALATSAGIRFHPWGSVQSRQQVPQFLMQGPGLIEYRWVKENRIQVAVATASLANVPITTGGGITNTGSGDFWYTNGTAVRIATPETASAPPETYQLKGFVGGIGNVATVTGDGTRISGFRYYDIPTLTQGSAITWDYSDRIYKGRVVIGEAINFFPGGTFTGGEAIPATDLLNTNKAPLATTIVSGAPPGSTVDDMRVWDDFADRLYPLRPGVMLLEWERQPGSTSTRSVFTEITVAFPPNASFTNIANTPPVPLDQDKTNVVTFLALKFAERSSASVNDASEFAVNDTTFTDPFWTVLLFSERTDGTPANGDLTQERLRVRTVLTRKWDNGLQLANADIGTPVVSSLHSAGVPHNGYVYFEKARYNPYIHTRSSRVGPIIPVNRHPTAHLDENLVVVWYRTQEGIHWPYQAVKYTPQWPTSLANRIVIASRLGSEGHDTGEKLQRSFAADAYEQVSVYNQPDRTLPGYNPNEEHAFIAPSLLNAAAATPPPTAYALRNDLNVTPNTDAYTSDPYVLVQYYDKPATNWNMAVYRVQIDDPNIRARRLAFPVNTQTSLRVALGTGNVVEFNLTSDTFSTTGMRSDEIVDLEPNGNLAGLTSGRYRINVTASGPPAKFVLVPVTGGAPITASAIVTNEYPNVVLTRSYPYVFEYVMKAGEPVLAPYPLQQIIGASPCSATTGENLDPNQLVYWEDHNKQPWAVSGSTSPTAGLRAQFYYPLQPDFWHPTARVGDCIAYVSNSAPVWVTNHVTWPSDVPVLKGGETLTYSGGERNRDNPNAPGVPGVIGWAAGRIVYDDANAAMNPSLAVTNYIARLGAPLATLTVPLAVSKMPAELQPAGGKVTVDGTEWTFNDLDASLQPRVFYDQISQKLGVRGFVDGKTIGDPTLTAAPGSISVLQPNILTPRDSNALVHLVASPPTDWVNAVSNLFRLSRDPLGATSNGYGIGLAPGSTSGTARPATQFGPGLALLPNAGLLDPNAGLRDGYVTLAENDDPSLGAAPVLLHIVKVQKQPLFRGAIKILNPPNPFDEKVTLRHSGDFGANAGDLVFEWYYRPDDGATVAPPDLAPPNTWSIFADSTDKRGQGMSEINLAGAGAVTLSDNRFFVRYRHVNPINNTNWSQWAGAANSRPPATNELAQNTYVPQLAEGWVKRVLGAINPFDARITDFRNNNSPATYASMVQQAGAPFRGLVALNPDKNVVENVGLIELYTTVIERAKDLSIDLSSYTPSPAVNNALLLAASRIADLQLLLGNEAYTDAQDPTIGYGTASSEYGALAPTIFCFQNQVATLLDEELALLRGRSEEGAYPAYNRLLWNFTRAEGEAAYALSYHITDQNNDGFINETDGRLLYPQGHGDAWGHYLSALRTYYDLLRHPRFGWQTRSETLAIDGVVVNVDYLDERKFTQAAAAKAKAGSEIVNLTYRSRYVEDPDGQWQGYQDTDPTRAWGVADWARRAGCAALFDWVTANAILPASITNKSGIEKVDRTTVKELAQISAQALDIRTQLDNANSGLNPIGLATDVVPFDIDPIGFDASTGQRTMHFDQVYDRALKALQNALDVFNNANQLNHMLRQVAETADQFAAAAAEQDLDYRNRLIEVFGTPYEGSIGPGKAYPAGYSGPDLYLYMYTDVTGIQDVPPPSSEFTAFFGPIDGGFVNTKSPSGGGNSIATVWNHYFAGDAPNLSDNINTDFSQTLELRLPQTASGYAFQAPADWGSRRAPGEIQQVLAEMVQAEADLQLALWDYDGLIGDIKDMAVMVQAQSGLQAESIRIQEAGRDRTTGLNAAIFAAQSVSAAMTLTAEQVGDLTEVARDSLPTVVGLATDAFSAARGILRGTGSVSKHLVESLALVSDRTAAFLEGTKEVAQIQQDIALQKADFKYAMQEQLKEFEGLLGDEAAKRIEVFRRQEALRQVSDKYRALLESGLRLLEERELHNKRTAGATQQNRYQDFTFRTARNDALSKYRAAFELAARYLYLAAKAYDYETNLDPNDPASARPILTQIIRARTLGALDNGAPRLGSGGLADALATLKVNFDTLKTQMGFNNPQTESGRFSLRNELFRIAPGPMLHGDRDTSTNLVSYAGQTMTAHQAWNASDTKWRDALQNTSGGSYTAKVVHDLWHIPEFRRHCRPFAPESAGAQPGLVITFGSQIVFGKNFFGWPLGGGDSAYDPSHFATKVRSVGLWFENYNGEGLSATPRAYLVPAGLDIMLVPTSTDLATREWNVVDQKIPLPLPITQSNLRDPAWIPLRDSLNGTLAEIRRYSMFRAYHDAGFTTDEMSTDSRLIGRSVWNTRWMLIVPGGTLLANGQDGLDTFLRGRVVPGSNPPVRDGNGVKDIKLFFQTYAYSGN